MDPVAAVVSAVIALVLAAWAAAELRRREAERQRDALRGQVLSFLGDVLKHAAPGANHFDKAMGLYDGAAWLLPMFSEAQYGASRMRAIERVVREAIRAIKEEDHGRIRGQEDRV